MGVTWVDMVRPGTEEEHSRFWRLVVAAALTLAGLLLVETNQDVADDGVCSSGEPCKEIRVEVSTTQGSSW